MPSLRIATIRHDFVPIEKSEAAIATSLGAIVDDEIARRLENGDTLYEVCLQFEEMGLDRDWLQAMYAGHRMAGKVSRGK